MQRTLRVLISLLTACLAFNAHAQDIKVVVSILPLYSMTAALMEGGPSPILLVPDSASPHHYALKPSQMRHLEQADLVLYAGPELEGFLSKALQNCTAQVLILSQTPGLQLLHTRAHGGNCHHHHGVHDLHFWLDPHNMKIIAQAVCKRLGQLNPQHRARFDANLARYIERLTELDARLTSKLAELKHRPFMVFHDAYQYFEKRYGLQQAGTISLNPERPLSAFELKRLHKQITEQKVQCLFSEPQFSSQRVTRLAKDNHIRHATLDPLGRDSQPVARSYFDMMESLGAAFVECLTTP